MTNSMKCQIVGESHQEYFLEKRVLAISTKIQNQLSQTDFFVVCNN